MLHWLVVVLCGSTSIKWPEEVLEWKLSINDVISDDHVYLRSQDLALILRMTECARITSAYIEPSDFRNNADCNHVSTQPYCLSGSSISPFKRSANHS